MDDLKFWLNLWRTVIYGTVAVVVTAAVYNAHDNYITASAAKALAARGINPVLAKCAIKTSEGGTQALLCAAAMGK